MNELNITVNLDTFIAITSVMPAGFVSDDFDSRQVREAIAKIYTHAVVVPTRNVAVLEKIPARIKFDPVYSQLAEAWEQVEKLEKENEEQRNDISELHERCIHLQAALDGKMTKLDDPFETMAEISKIGGGQ